ncbi:MAG: hypothetical protein C00003105_01861 [ANME-2 cluster archaeon HR1]|nr:MAG: hypothetical protein C00003105_01861 [ANME-2 cluster archaeon HR1]
MISNINRVTFIIISGIVALTAILIVSHLTWLFVDVIILSLFLAYILYPLDKTLRKITKIKNRNISAFLTIAIVVLIFVGVFLNILRVLFAELSGLDLATIEESIRALMEPGYDIIESIIPYFNREGFGEDLSNFIISIVWFIVDIVYTGLTSFASNIGIITMKCVLIVFLSFYILVDNDKILKSYTELVPANRVEAVNKFLFNLNNIYHSLFHVFLFVCLLGGFIGAIGFFLIGVPNPAMWGSMIAIFSLLPIVGPATIYVPIALYYLMTGEWQTAVIIVIYGQVFMDIIPGNIIRPKLMMTSGQIHPIITLLAFTTALFVIGPIGIIIGPAAYGFLLALYRSFVETESNAQSDLPNKEELEDEQEPEEIVEQEKLPEADDGQDEPDSQN